MINNSGKALEDMGGVISFAFKIFLGLTSLIAVAFVFSSLLYACLYYYLIPVSMQEAPLHFKFQKTTESEIENSQMMFATQH